MDRALVLKILPGLAVISTAWSSPCYMLRVFSIGCIGTRATIEQPNVVLHVHLHIYRKHTGLWTLENWSRPYNY